MPNQMVYRGKKSNGEVVQKMSEIEVVKEKSKNTKKSTQRDKESSTPMNKMLIEIQKEMSQKSDSVKSVTIKSFIILSKNY